MQKKEWSKVTPRKVGMVLKRKGSYIKEGGAGSWLD